MSLLLKALHNQNISSRPPIWLMRQAGRYLPEYRKMREKYPFLTMCKTPEISAEVTLMPLKRYPFDAGIIFSDIMVIADAYRLGLSFEEGKGPVVETYLTKKTVLETPDVEESLFFVKEAIKLVKKMIDVPLLGFAGAPFTVASYLLKGGVKEAKLWMMEEEDSFHHLLKELAKTTISYLNMQIDAGVDAVQIFDSSTSFLSDSFFQKFSFPYLRLIREGLKNPEIPVIVFCKGSSSFAPILAKIPNIAISLDWQSNLLHMRQQIPSVLQGNLDPELLFAPLHVIKREVQQIVQSMKNDPGYIFNLGHGILPETPLDAVSSLIEGVYEA